MCAHFAITSPIVSQMDSQTGSQSVGSCVKEAAWCVTVSRVLYALRMLATCLPVRQTVRQPISPSLHEAAAWRLTVSCVLALQLLPDLTFRQSVSQTNPASRRQPGSFLCPACLLCFDYAGPLVSCQSTKHMRDHTCTWYMSSSSQEFVTCLLKPRRHRISIPQKRLASFLHMSTCTVLCQQRHTPASQISGTSCRSYVCMLPNICLCATVHATEMMYAIQSYTLQQLLKLILPQKLYVSCLTGGKP